MAALGAAAQAAAGLIGVAAPMEQAEKLFKQQIAQDRRFFYVQYAEGVAYHQEQVEQAARNHAQAYAQTAASYWQTEQFHRRDFTLARLQHKRDLEVTLEAEVRDGLRDEFAIKNNRFNTLMVCDTVMMGCAFGVLSDGVLPAGTPRAVVWCFMSGLAVSISLLTVSLWCSFIVSRRLNQVTAWGLMESQMHDKSQMMEQWEQRNERLQKTFDNWFLKHCHAMSRNAENALTCGVLGLFVAASALLYARMEHELDAGSTSAWLFVGFASATALFIVILERREARMKKKKQGVYHRDRDQPRQTSALNASIDHLLQHTNREFGFESEATKVDSVQATDALLVELQRTAAAKQRAWDAVPSVEEVVDEAARAQAFAGTEEWLQKAHELLREGHEGDKEWKRDPNEDLFLIGKQAAAGRKAPVGSPRTPPPLMPEESDEAFVRRGNSQASLQSFATATDSSRVTFGLPPTLAAASKREMLTGGGMRPVPSSRSLGSSRALGTLRDATADGEGIRRASHVEVTDMRKSVGDYARSSIITIVNRTDTALRLTQQSLTKGEWCGKATPPEVIQPRSEALFAACNETMFITGIPTGGTEGSVAYETAHNVTGDRSDVWTFELSWSNPLVITDPRGRYVEHTTTPPDRQFSLAEYYCFDDSAVDQDPNNELRFTVAARDDDNAEATGDVGVESGLRLDRGEVIHAGLLEKCNAKGVMWERRLFMLTETRILYVENKRSTQPKRAMQLTQVATVEADEYQPQEFSVKMQGNTADQGGGGDAGRVFQLRAASGEEAEAWVETISVAVKLARSAIRLQETIKCQPRDRVVDLKLAIAQKFGVEPVMQELRCAPEVDDSGELRRTNTGLHRVLADDLAQLHALGLRDGHAVSLHEVVSSAGGADGAGGMDLHRTISSELRERVSRSFSMHDATGTVGEPEPEPETEVRP